MMALGPTDRTIGGMAVIPGAIIGLVGLADYAGPTGWRGFAEFIGWAAFCLAASFAAATLVARIRLAGSNRSVALVTLAAALASFTAIPLIMGSNIPSMDVKLAFTSLLQGLGVAAITAAPAWMAFISWTGFRRP